MVAHDTGHEHEHEHEHEHDGHARGRDPRRQPAARLEARGLSFGYEPDAPVLHDLSLHVEPGELVAVVGPNGAGKSTVVRLLAGILRADEGDVLLDDTSLARVPIRARARQIALVPQDATLPGDLTVERFIEGGRYSHLGFWKRCDPEDRKAIDAALANTDLEEIRQRPLAEMSSGQRQRALMARAMAQEARILLVDEPTTSLDAHHQIKTFELILDLVRHDHAALVITHELNLASQFASRVILIDAGRVIAEGSPSEVFRPAVLEPVYGKELHYGQLADSPWGEPRPFLVPWVRSAKSSAR